MKNMKYGELRDKQQKEFNDFPIFFAFSEEQLKEGLQKLKTTKDNLISIGYGGFIRKEDKKAYLDLLNKHHNEMESAMKDDEFVFQMFRYELANHEYCITYDYSETLDALGLTWNELDNRMKRLLVKARDDYLRDYHKHNEESQVKKVNTVIKKRRKDGVVQRYHKKVGVK